LFFCRKNFCGYARVDIDLNYTSDVSHEEDLSDNEGMFCRLHLQFTVFSVITCLFLVLIFSM